MQHRLLKHAASSDGLLRGNIRYQFSAAHALKIYRSNSIYTFIPKNACTTMRLSLAIANCCIADESGVNWIHNNNTTFKASLEDLVRADYTFVILRDPFARIASCYLDKIVGKAPAAWQLFDHCGRAWDIDRLSFADFVSALKGRAMLTVNEHWRPQSDFLVYQDYDDYFSVEELAAAIPAIRQKADMEVKDARPLTLHGIDRYELRPADQDHAETPAGEIAEMQRRGQCPHPRSLYRRPIIDAVAQLYADDLRLYAEKVGRPTWFEVST